jgi:hypothetical protein
VVPFHLFYEIYISHNCLTLGRCHSLFLVSGVQTDFEYSFEIQKLAGAHSSVPSPGHLRTRSMLHQAPTTTTSHFAQLGGTLRTPPRQDLKAGCQPVLPFHSPMHVKPLPHLLSSLPLFCSTCDAMPSSTPPPVSRARVDWRSPLTSPHHPLPFCAGRHHVEPPYCWVPESLPPTVGAHW